jgi:hypothetical protein
MTNDEINDFENGLPLGCSGCGDCHIVSTKEAYDAAHVAHPNGMQNSFVFMCPSCLTAGIDKLPVTEWKGYHSCDCDLYEDDADGNDLPLESDNQES